MTQEKLLEDIQLYEYYKEDDQEVLDAEKLKQELLARGMVPCTWRTSVILQLPGVQKYLAEQHAVPSHNPAAASPHIVVIPGWFIPYWLRDYWLATPTSELGMPGMLCPIQEAIEIIEKHGKDSEELALHIQWLDLQISLQSA